MKRYIPTKNEKREFFYMNDNMVRMLNGPYPLVDFKRAVIRYSYERFKEKSDRRLQVGVMKVQNEFTKYNMRQLLLYDKMAQLVQKQISLETFSYLSSIFNNHNKKFC